MSTQPTLCRDISPQWWLHRNLAYADKGVTFYGSSLRNVAIRNRQIRLQGLVCLLFMVVFMVIAVSSMLSQSKLNHLKCQTFYVILNRDIALNKKMKTDVKIFWGVMCLKRQRALRNVKLNNF